MKTAFGFDSGQKQQSNSGSQKELRDGSTRRPARTGLCFAQLQNFWSTFADIQKTKNGIINSDFKGSPQISIPSLISAILGII